MMSRDFGPGRWYLVLPLAIAVLAFSPSPAAAQALTPLVFNQVEGRIREKYNLAGSPEVRWADIEGEFPLSGTFLISGAVDIPVGAVTVETKPFYAIVQLFFGLGALVTSVQVGGLELPPGTDSASPGPGALFSARPAAVPSNASGGATGASADGSTIIGYIDHGPSTPFHAFHWIDADGIIDLGTLDPANDAMRSSFAHDVSADGSVVVGFSDTGASGTMRHAFRWSQSGGMIDLGAGAGAGTDRASLAFGVSGDGNVVVGESHFDGSSGLLYQAFRWTSGGGFQNLGALQPDRGSSATAVTADGAVVVGFSGLSVTVGNTTTGGMHAFRWTQSGGMQDLGALAGHRYSAATAVSDDGSIVVGLSSTNPIDRAGVGGAFRYDRTPANTRAFYWTEAQGIQDLTQLLADAGVDLTGTTIVSCSSISADGVWMSGEAVTATPANQTTGVFFSLTYAPAPETSRLLNLSTRGLAQSGDNVLIPGFVISGTANKRLLIRAVGPTLNDPSIGFTGTTIPNPMMTLKRLDTSVTPNVYVDHDANDDWETNANAGTITTTAASLGAFAFKSAHESALLVDLPAGQYSVIARDKADTSGIAIVELYDADAAAVDARLINISNRGFCGVGDQVMIPGFVISSESPRTVLVRVVGPTLASFGVPGTMADPKLEIFPSGASTPILANDNWSDNPDAANTATVAQQVFAFPLAQGSADAAFVVTLPPGGYTVVGSSAIAGGTGVALVELYVVP